MHTLSGWDGVKKYYSRQLHLSSSRDGVPWAWGMVKRHLPAIQFILAVRLMPILTPLSSRWTVIKSKNSSMRFYIILYLEHDNDDDDFCFYDDDDDAN